MSGELEALRTENERLRRELERREEDEKLSLEEYRRYGRQLIMGEVGIKGQLRLKKAKVLVVGAGGLGCPVLAYLGGAGVGTIGIVDNDTVDASNLHRQILHDAKKVGMSKAESARQFLNNQNDNVNVQIHNIRLLPDNVFDIFRQYDLVLDCTDTPNTRYLISDAAVILGLPLVSASALKTEGQLSVLNFKDGPCYRCFFPVPPPPDSVLSCGDGGILGPVVGVMGVMQSIEAIKVITGAYEDRQEFKPSLTLFSAYSMPQWRTIRMRGKKSDCATCGESPTITKESIESGETDYTAFCGLPTQVTLSPAERVSVKRYAELRDMPHTLIDVREKPQFEICSLEGAVNKPYMGLKSGKVNFEEGELQEPVYVCCRYGNDSQATVKMLKEQYNIQNVYDIQGGLDKWSQDVDEDFPRY